MEEKQPNLYTNSRFFSFSKYTIILSLIIGTSFIIRLYFFPTQVPLNSDALLYFWYSSDILITEGLPRDWAPVNNGWPSLVGFLFTVFDSHDVFSLMQIQRWFSVIISIFLTIPAYFLCKKFVERKYAIIGASLISFDPRLLTNSFLGITDPLYLLLATSSLTLFLCSNKKLVYLSFALVSLATIVRAEGLFIFGILSIMFFIRYRKENYKVFFKYILVLGIFVIIIIPVSMYRIEVNGEDGIFSRVFSSGEQFNSNVIQNDSVNTNSENRIILGLEVFFKYFIWVMIPNFIIFIPLGIFLIFKNRNFKTNTIILSLGLLSLPALYAYTVPALDTRYLYVLFPIFSVISVISIERILRNVNKSNLIIVLIISCIIISSIMFYEFIKIDVQHEEESFKIMNKISSNIGGVNILDPEYSYLFSSQTINQWPTKYTEMNLVETFDTKNFDSLNEYVSNFKDKGLTHIIVDDKNERPQFLKEVFFEKNNSFLEKVYDSKEDGFVYHVKVFKINYDSFSKSIIND